MLSVLATLAIGLGAMAADTPGFTLHEWGTFTSVSGSDGVLLPGLQREEEALPGFVYQHDGMTYRPKGYARPLHNVTIKLETPVIYFYTDQPFSAHVQVGFNGGSISQWFPNRSGGETPPPIKISPNGLLVGGDIDFATPYHGSIEWNVQVIPPSIDDSATVFKPYETLTWTCPRQADSALVRTADGAAEKFLFYRGVGNFTLPVKFTLPDDRTLQIENDSDAAIPAVLIFNHPQYDMASFTLLNSMAAGEKRSVELPDPTATTNWEHEVYITMRAELIKAGLYPKEADAMLQTWWGSYFERPGLRAFWIVPGTFTSAVLPMAVAPAPQKETRVLVGRSELLTPSFERNLVTQFAQTNQNRWPGDRYFLAYQARVKALTADH